MGKRSRLIGIKFIRGNSIKREFLPGIKKKGQAFAIEVRESKPFGARAEIYNFTGGSYTKYILGGIRENKQKEDPKKRILNGLKNNDKPIDKSTWVKPDEQTIREDMVTSLFLLQLLNEDASEYEYYKGRYEVCYSILHEMSPKNPQTLSVTHIGPPFITILQEYKKKLAGAYWNNWHKLLRTRTARKRSMEAIRKIHHKHGKSILNKMIVYKGEIKNGR